MSHNKIRITQFQVDKIYLISKYALQEIDKSSGDCEVILTSESVVEEWLDENETVPTLQYNIVPLSQIPNMIPHTPVGKSN